MKQIITITTAVILLICFSTVQAHADRKTMEGFMLGTGVAILGAAIISGINNDRRPRRVLVLCCASQTRRDPVSCR